MSGTINFAIDLGTTNSLIAKAGNGGVEIFKNPAGMKETLPSVVAFRKERILIGDKAREYIEKDALNVFGGFKRKMGTTDSFFISNYGSFKTPIELSTLVLQELKNFIYTGEMPESVVITIPASFDTIQSNATKEAGYAAGFKEVLLLQEPIAASLAFANKEGEGGIDSQWLVYDLGGGTFDVALVKVEDDEMKVTDHEGDNFLGGLDFDQLIVTRLLIPYIETSYTISDLATKMLSANGRYNRLYYQLLYKAEEAKIALSNSASADIEFDLTDEAGEQYEVFITITKTQFDDIIEEKILYSIDFIRKLLERNQLTSAAIQEIVLVGGSTYIPLVRSLLHTQLNIKVNAGIDPTTAVVVGAAYYAGGRTSSLDKKESTVVMPVADMPLSTIEVRTAYQKNTREKEEYFAAVIRNAPAGTYYRITREDGGFDSGLKLATEKISEMLVLLPNTLNVFKLQFFTERQHPLNVAVPDITITQGKFSIHGQPLPNDICLEVDDTENNTTVLEVIFERNNILPIRKNVTKTLSRTIAKNSDDQLLINILEGSRYASPASNLPIGIISIEGKKLQSDLIKGSDIELTFEISESRDITVIAYISMIDEEIKQVFSPSARSVNIIRMQEEVDYLHRVGRRQLDGLLAKENYEEGVVLQQALEELEMMQTQLRNISADDVTDVKYQLDDRKRKLAQVIDATGKDDKLLALKEKYYRAKDTCKYFIEQAADKPLMARFEKLGVEESEWITNCSTQFIRWKTDEMERLSWHIQRKDIGYVTSLYMGYAMLPDEAYSDVKASKALKSRGDDALTRQNPDEILSIIHQLYALLIDKGLDEAIKGTGLRG